MAYRQEPGRGPSATFKNVTALLGPTVTEGEKEREKERGKEKVTRETKTDINPETGMKRYTTITTRQGEGRGGSGTGIRYEDAYKKADKSKYPTLEGFVKAAKDYKKSYTKKDVKVVEQIPIREAKITTSSQPKLRTIETTKEPETSITVEKKKKTTKPPSRRPKPRKIKGSGLVKTKGKKCTPYGCFKF